MYDQNAKSALMNTAGACDAPQSAVAGALENLSGEQKRTRSLLDLLDARINPILSAQAPTKPGVDPGQMHASQLHGDICNRAAAQSEINAVLEGLLSRVTV